MKAFVGKLTGLLSRSSEATKVVIIAKQEGRRWPINAKKGDNLMEATIGGVKQELHLFGVCNKELACLSCSVHICKKGYAQLNPPTNEELDLLYSLQDYREGSTRMSCQVKLTPEMNGKKTLVFQADDHSKGMEVEVASQNKFIG